MSAVIPACMDADELADWHALRERSTAVKERNSATPCGDCLLGFAADMRAVGRCNGRPGGAAVDTEEETPDMTDTAIPASTVPVVVEVPCGGCAHAAICRIAPSLRSIGRVSAAFTAPDPAVTFTLAASVTCEHFARARGAVAAPGKRTISPEGRARMAEAARAVSARRKAEREAAAA